MRSKFRSALLAVLLTAPLFAQSAAQLESDDVKRVASRLACQCGSCKSTVDCQMPGGCGFCKKIKTSIAQMQAVGLSDQQIIDKIVRENGADMYLAPPGTWGFLIPYFAVALGLGVIYLFVRRSMRTQAAAVPGVSPEVFDRYHDRIEKDLEKLD